MFQVRRDVHLVESDERAVKTDFARDDAAELALQEFVHAE
jgi:hypothetical protein